MKIFPKFFGPLWDAGGEIYEVGGSVRDRLLGQAHKDKDLLVRRLEMDRLKAILAPYGRVALVGKSFGVLKFTPYHEKDLLFDIALPRTERSTGAGHRDFEVRFDPDLPVEEDLGRRDFTLNAMAFDLKTERMIDPFGGQKDLEAKILRMVFDRAFEEDPLRMVRAVQFCARFRLTLEAKTCAAIQREANAIRSVSPERITEELRKLFAARSPSAGIELMRQTGLLPLIFPEVAGIISIEQDKMPGDDVYQHTLRVLDATRSDDYVEHPGDLELMLAALFHDVGKATTRQYDRAKNRIVFYGHQLVSRRMARHWMRKMKVTTLGIDPKNVETLIADHMFETKSYFTEKAIRRFVRKIGEGLIFRLLDLRLADNRGGKHPRSIQGVLKMRQRVRQELAKKPPFGPKDLTVTGHDLMALGLPQGPRIGQILKGLVEMALDDPALNTREQLLAIAKDMIDSEKK